MYTISYFFPLHFILTPEQMLLNEDWERAINLDWMQIPKNVFNRWIKNKESNKKERQQKYN